MSRPTRRALSAEDYAQGVLAGNRAVLGRAISLIESSASKHRATARALLERLMPHTGNAVRIGVTGVPGAGKSTFIERFGRMLTAQERRVAVLAVDPSSGITGGSILGDKTRMAELSTDENAFIRPSPSAGTLGGVASKTRESMLICEAAAFDTVIIETVGVGQSESVVSGMVDCFLGLFIPNAGDELQGIKRGLLELLDIIAINKADGDNLNPARIAAKQIQIALHHTSIDREPPPVLTCSALTGDNLREIWDHIRQRDERERSSGTLQQRRREQATDWMWSMIDEQLRQRFRNDNAVNNLLPEITECVRQGTLPATRAAETLLDAFGSANR